MRVLLVEDDLDLANVVLLGLRQDHLAVDHATNLADAIDCVTSTAYDVVLLDLTLPDGDGLDLCRMLQDDSRITRPRRLLILTARDAVPDRVAGLDAGADDYLIKPFTMAELTARIRALARRDQHVAGPIHLGDLTVDVVNHVATRRDVNLRLTGREFTVLRYLASRSGEIVSAEQLLEHCWDSNADSFSNSGRVILSRLRSKLGDPPMIETIRGVGYRLASLDEATPDRPGL